MIVTSAAATASSGVKVDPSPRVLLWATCPAHRPVHCGGSEPGDSRQSYLDMLCECPQTYCIRLKAKQIKNRTITFIFLPSK